MNFNGRFYNKPGHLGMTRAELLEKLNGGTNVIFIPLDITIDGDSIVLISKDKIQRDVLYATDAIIVLGGFFEGIEGVIPASDVYFYTVFKSSDANSLVTIGVDITNFTPALRTWGYGEGDYNYISTASIPIT